MEVSEPKLVTFMLDIIRVNSLWFGDQQGLSPIHAGYLISNSRGHLYFFKSQNFDKLLAVSIFSK